MGDKEVLYCMYNVDEFLLHLCLGFHHAFYLFVVFSYEYRV